MVREFIERQDTLNQGRVKLNRAIDRAYNANEKSDTAITTSNKAMGTSEEANNKSDYTQAQLDMVIGASTIDPAVEQLKVGSNGQTYPSPDARIRSEHEKVTAQLAETTNKVKYVKSSALPKKNLNTVDYKVFRALITNPLKGIKTSTNNYTNPYVQVKISFSMGECKNESCMEVLTDSGASLPFQWDGERDPNFIKGRGRDTYPDGSLKHGVIWVKLNTTVSDDSSIYLTIRVWDKEINVVQTGNVTVTPSKTVPEDPLDNYNLIANAVDVTFNWRDGYYPSLVKIGETISSTKVFDPKVKNNLYADIINYENTNILKHEIVGSGVIFKDFISEISYKYNTSIKAKMYFRLFSDGSFTIEHFFFVDASLGAGALNGLDIRVKYDGTPNVFMRNAVHTGAGIMLLHDLQIQAGTNDTNNYISKELFGMDTANKMISAGWKLSSGTTFAIPTDSFWSAKYVFKPFTSSVTSELQSEGLKIMNPIVTRATSTHSLVDKATTLDLLREFVLTQHPLIGRNGWNLFKGCNVLSKIAYQRITGTVNPIGIYNDTKAFLSEFYAGGTTQGFWNSWSGGRGLEYLARDTVCLPFVHNLLLDSSEKTKADEIAQIMHNLADFYLQVELNSGMNSAEGYIALSYSASRTIKTMVPNAAAAALRDLKASMDISSNAPRSQAFERIKNKFFAVNTFYNYSPHVENTSNFLRPEIHYEYFSGFDYTNAVVEKSYVPVQRVLEMINASGSVNELRSNYANNRRGLVHTLFYAIGILFERGQMGDYAHAYAIAQNVLNKCYPDGYHEQPLDLYVNNDPKSASAPIELAVAAEIILHHE